MKQFETGWEKDEKHGTWRPPSAPKLAADDYALPRGLVTKVQLATSTGAYDDWEEIAEFVTPVPVVAGRTYKATIHGIFQVSASSSWIIQAWLTGPHGVQMVRQPAEPGFNPTFEGVGVWTADGTGLTTFHPWAVRAEGTGTVEIMEHTDAISFLIIEDIGIA